MNIKRLIDYTQKPQIYTKGTANMWVIGIYCWRIFTAGPLAGKAGGEIRNLRR